MFQKARVTRINSEKHSVDVTLMDSQRPLAGVFVLSEMCSTNHGKNNLVDPTFQPLDPFEQKNTEIRDIYAIVAFAEEIPFVLGFIYPEITQMHFTEHNFSIDRHGSDFYHTLKGSADFEAFHPSGTYLRLAEDLEHQDLTHTDYDELFEIKDNLNRRPGFRMRIVNKPDENEEHATFATIQCDADGNIDIINRGYLHSVTDGDVDVTGMQTVTINAHGEMTINALSNLTVNTTGTTVVNSSGEVDVNSNAAVNITAPVTNVNSPALNVSGIVYAEDFVIP